MDITTLYQQALLSEADFATATNSGDGFDSGKTKTALIASGLSSAQVDEFTTNWTVISHR